LTTPVAKKTAPAKRGASAAGSAREVDVLGGEGQPEWISGAPPAWEQFAAAYLANGGSGADAVMAVWPKTATRNAARLKASKLLAKPEVRALITQLHSTSMAARRVTINRIVAETARIAFVDPRRLYWSAKDAQARADVRAGDLKPVPELDDDTAAALAGIDVHKDFLEGVEVGETRKVKLAPKLGALELLAKYRGMLNSEGAKLPVFVVSIKL
jgi:phage terminase small subunit